MTRIKTRLTIAMFASLVGLATVPAAAQGSRQDAVAKYKEGRALIEEKRYDEALRALTVSYEMLESPNTLLLMAHAQRELGHEKKAASLYEKVIADAKTRVANGEARFEKTAADAKEWLDKLAERLGKISIVVSGATDGTTVTVDGTPVDGEATSDGNLKVGATWWAAGPVKVQATTPEGVTRSMNAEIPRGGTASVALDLGSASSDEPVPPVEDTTTFDTKDIDTKTIPTASWVTGGIGVAGLATFAIFGSMAKSKSADLDECSPRCPESERDVADAGKRDQTIANVGLAVGGIGLAAAAGFYFFQSPPEEAGNLDVGVAPNGLLIRGTFQ